MDYWHDRVVLVTGGSSGLGAQLVRQLLQRGARVAVAARDTSRLAAQAAQLADKASIDTEQRLLQLPTDITQAADVENSFAQLHAKWGKLDALINCAGRSWRGRVTETTADQFDQLWQLNFLGTVRCTRAALPMLSETRGHLVNIGSLAAKVAPRFLGAYPASKFAVAAYSQQLRLELQPQGIHVLLVCPGPITRSDSTTRYAEQMEGLPEAAQRPGGGARVRTISPEHLAQQILRACQRRQPELIVPSKSRWLFAIGQLWPSLGDWLLTKFSSAP
jgi:short-subunit dehydrogenase